MRAPPVRYTGYTNRFHPGGEMKFHDVSYSATTTSATGQITNSSLVLIQGGTGESQRVGRRIKVKSISIRGYVFLPDGTDAAKSADMVRIVVYGDRQTNKAAATVANLLDSTDFLSFNNIENSLRFKTLAQRTITVHASGVGSASTPSVQVGRGLKPFQINIKLNAIIEYAGTTAAITELTSANIGVMIISQGAAAQVEYIARVRYTDV